MSQPGPSAPPHGVELYDHGDRLEVVVQGRPRSPLPWIVAIGALLVLGALSLSLLQSSRLVTVALLGLVVATRLNQGGRLTPAVTRIPSLVVALQPHEVSVRERGGHARAVPYHRLEAASLARHLGRWRLRLEAGQHSLDVGRGQDPAVLYWLEREVRRRAATAAPGVLDGDRPAWLPAAPVPGVAVRAELDRLRLDLPPAPLLGRRTGQALGGALLLLAAAVWVMVDLWTALAVGAVPAVALTLAPGLATSVELTGRSLEIRERLGPLVTRRIRTPLEALRAVVGGEGHLQLDLGSRLVRVGRGQAPEALGWLKGVMERARRRRREALRAEGLDGRGSLPPRELVDLVRRR